MTLSESYYLDTNCLLHVRHYIECKELSEDLYPQGVFTGKKIFTALENCLKHRDKINLFSSRLAKFELFQLYRRWNAKKVFLEHRIPLEAIDGRKTQDLFGSLGQTKLSPQISDNYQRQMLNNSSWLDAWEFRDLVIIELLQPKIFEVVEPFFDWAPGLELFDALHFAMAVILNCTFFVSSDGELLNHLKRIDSKLREKGFLPTGEKYELPVEAINVNTFLARTRFGDERAKKRDSSKSQGTSTE